MIRVERGAGTAVTGAVFLTVIHHILVQDSSSASL
jgi:hypothetical protein